MPNEKDPKSLLDIKRGGTDIILPEGVTLEEADEFLHDKIREERSPFSETAVFDGHPIDGLVCFHRAAKKRFGVTLNRAPEGTGPAPTIEVEVAPGVRETFAHGIISCAGLPGVTLRLTPDFKSLRFYIQAEGPKKNLPPVRDLFDAVRKELQEHSIFKGQAIDSAFKFLSVDKASFEGLAFNTKVKAALEANLFVPVRHRARLREIDMTFKRGVLLYGLFGTGKTETAYAVAKEARDNGITFFYVKPENYDALQQLLTTVRAYAPVVIFYEDLDLTAGEGEERSPQVNALLNEIDGISSKAGHEVMLVCTTNNVEVIEPALLRPGRFDAVIELEKPDADTRKALIERYAGTRIAPNFDWERAVDGTDGMVPAFINESVRRASLFAMSRANGRGVQITGADVEFSAQTMTHQLKLAQPRPDEPSLEEKVGIAMRDMQKEALAPIIRYIES